MDNHEGEPTAAAAERVLDQKKHLKLERIKEETNRTESPKTEPTAAAPGKGLDQTKQLLQWLYTTKSPRLTFHMNTKGKNRFLWRQFRIAYIDDEEQAYAMCIGCQIFVKYSARTGTGGLVRHYCFRQVLAAINTPEDSPPPEIPKPTSPSPTRVEVEELVHRNSPRVSYVPNYKGKSNVWEQFDIITVDNEPVNFAACKICRCIVTYVSRTGTGSMARHKCQMNKRPISPREPEDLAKRVKQEGPDTPPSDLSRANIAQMQLSAFLHANLENYREKSERASPPMREPREEYHEKPESGSPPLPQREPPEDSVTRDYVQMLRRSLDMFNAMRNDQFYSLAQALVNLGAEYGKVDIRQMLMDSTDMDTVFSYMD